MGHQHLLTIPRTREWRQVVALIGAGADLNEVAAASSRAVERSMIDAGEDETVRQAFFLLARIPLAARSSDFTRELGRIGINAGEGPTLERIAAAMMEAIDRFTDQHGRRTDYGEISQICAVESLYGVTARGMGDLFESGPEQVRRVLANLAGERQFSVLARDFFSRLTRRHLNFYLQRELANHVGDGRRFPGLADLAAFEQAIEQHCHEASRIIKEFAGQWFCKHAWAGGIEPDLAGRFVHVAAGKIRSELARGVSANA